MTSPSYKNAQNSSSEQTQQFASEPASPSTKTRKSRASKPKSKNGCRTCKIRRVKCDETKPECERCRKFGQRCEGYAADIRNNKSGSSYDDYGARLLAPKGTRGSEPQQEGMNNQGSNAQEDYQPYR